MLDLFIVGEQGEEVCSEDININQFWFETTVCTSLNVFLFKKAQIKNIYIKL